MSSFESAVKSREPVTTGVWLSSFGLIAGFHVVVSSEESEFCAIVLEYYSMDNVNRATELPNLARLQANTWSLEATRARRLGIRKHEITGALKKE